MLWMGVEFSLPWLGGGENTFSSWLGSHARRRLGMGEGGGVGAAAASAKELFPRAKL
jgi:hypothetical protein